MDDSRDNIYLELCAKIVASLNNLTQMQLDIDVGDAVMFWCLELEALETAWCCSRSAGL